MISINQHLTRLDVVVVALFKALSDQLLQALRGDEEIYSLFYGMPRTELSAIMRCPFQYNLAAMDISITGSSDVRFDCVVLCTRLVFVTAIRCSQPNEGIHFRSRSEDSGTAQNLRRRHYSCVQRKVIVSSMLFLSICERMYGVFGR